VVRSRPEPRPAHPARRLAVCGVLVLVVFGALAIRVTQLQVLSGNRYRLMSLHQTQHELTVQPQRGTIFDRDGRDLAMSIELSAVVADPQQVLDPIAYAARLEPVLNVPDAELRALLSDRKYAFKYLAHRVSDQVVEQVKHLGLPGISFVPESARRYPAGSLAGSLIGDVSGDGRGLFGLEYLYDRLLRGTPGQAVVERDQQGLVIPNTASHQLQAERGSDVVTTLDEPLQWETEQSLIDEVSATRAKGGMAVVVDVTTGDVVAMASIDGATATAPAHPSGPTEATRPLMDLFEPGSTNKLITLSTAIENGLVQPDTVIDVPSALLVGDARFTDVEVHGDVKMTVAEILGHSSNIGTIKIAQRLSPATLASALRRFGLGAKTNVQFPGQATGILRDPAHYYSTGLASTAIGYGVAVTGMQMLDAYVTIANGGVTVPPHLLAATVDPKGKRHAAIIGPGRRVVSSHTAQEMSNMLTGVVTTGTGACAAIPGYTVAGKTGTAHKALGGGYSEGTMASFIGYAPAAHPKLAAIVVLDEPANTYGGTAAAPVFADVMQFALTHNGVAPDDPSNSQYNSSRASAAANGTTCVDPAAYAASQNPSNTPATGAGKSPAGKSSVGARGVTTTTSAAHPTTSTGAATSTSPRSNVSTTTGSNGAVSASARRPKPSGGGTTTPGSLPVDTSQSG
jgi:cell division protein FtsI (penicillin-binding protein 3)